MRKKTKSTGNWTNGGGSEVLKVEELLLNESTPPICSIQLPIVNLGPSVLPREILDATCEENHQVELQSFVFNCRLDQGITDSWSFC